MNGKRKTLPPDIIDEIKQIQAALKRSGLYMSEIDIIRAKMGVKTTLFEVKKKGKKRRIKVNVERY